jgi:FixJ family two-component response regulator
MPKGGKPFVAIIDDDESVCRATQRLLRALGIGAETYQSGQDFLVHRAAIPSYRPDCIILDAQMPGLHGLEVQKRLARSGIPIIFITAHDDVGVRDQALAGGAVAFLRKPFNDELLIKAVSTALGSDPKELGAARQQM